MTQQNFSCMWCCSCDKPWQYLNPVSEFREKTWSQSTKQTQVYLQCRSNEFPFLFNTKVILKIWTHEKMSILFPKYNNCLTHFFGSHWHYVCQCSWRIDKSLCHRQVSPLKKKKPFTLVQPLHNIK
jgi:hypothetical protein